MRALENIRVVDLSKVIAGPLCAQYLGALGADVIKVEPVGKGDDTRAWPPQDGGESAVFMSVNHNKRSIALDLKTEMGRGICHDLVRDADVVLQGFGSGTARKLGVDSEALMRLNPRLIYCEISGYGREGPLGDQPGYDVMLQAFSGMISTMGDREGHSVRASFSPVDIGSAMLGMGGVLAALIERGRTGKGVYVEISLLDTALGFMTYMAQSYWRSGREPVPMGTAHPTMCPYQAFEASGGAIMLGAGTDAQWRRFCAVAGLREYVDHPHFATNALRVENMEETVALVQTKIKTKTVAEWTACLQKADVPCSPIHTLRQALEHPQVATRELIFQTEHPAVGALRQIGLPVKFDGEARVAQAPPPLLGQHTLEILKSLGYGAELIESIMKSDAVA